ncbi:clathrin light chain [Holotrichia oblita]|uniref:Clathrin light chain n=1 Tax=Holotrichia oblita TaxID=644536 RepID=A0ACB9T9J8_HOLOL|nr:clathrin light chain [Holotrichia oblita]
MANFGDNFDQFDVDPAAEFLAKEQSDLAGLEDELKPAAVLIPQVNGDGATTNTIRENSGSSFEMIDGLEQENLEFSKPSNGVSTSPPLIKTELKEEPEKIRKWREEQVQRLEEKGTISSHLYRYIGEKNIKIRDLKYIFNTLYKNKEICQQYQIPIEKKKLKKEEWRETAKEELEEWYSNHAEQIEKTKAANRNAEKQFVADDNEIEPGTEWERIAKLCDFNPKAKQGNKDVSRLRSIILQLKQSPISAKNA